MVKTMSDNVSSSSADETKKQRKKQAKREAKAMLAVERAKAGVEKAQQKIAKAQARLEARAARLRTLETRLFHLREAHQGSEADTSQADLNGQQGQTALGSAAAGDNEYAAALSSPASEPFTIIEEDEARTGAPPPASPVNTPPPRDQEVSLPPVEGRPDILPQEQETASQTSGSSATTANTDDDTSALPEEQWKEDTASAGDNFSFSGSADRGEHTDHSDNGSGMEDAGSDSPKDEQAY